MKAYYQQKVTAPEEAGLAKLKYGAVESPSRKGKVITLPEEGWGLYQLLPDFSQFLAIKDKPDKAHDGVKTRCSSLTVGAILGVGLGAGDEG